MQEELIQEAEVVETTINDTTTEPEVTFNKVKTGDWTLKCSCGKEVVLAPNISGGLQIIAPVEEAQPWVLQCECGNKFELYYTNITEHDEHINQTSEAEELDNGVSDVIADVDKLV